MGREIRRVPLDFDFPLDETWSGFLSPDELDSLPCPDCKSGRSKRAEYLHDLWYGNVPFRPEDTGSMPYLPSAPAIRSKAERNVAHAPDYYGVGETAIGLEAMRLTTLYNNAWCHHLAQEDVEALVEGDRLREFTHTFDANRNPRWEKIEPAAVPTAAQVNEWSLTGFGHDGINAHIAIEARCKREGVESTCQTCEGEGGIEAYPGQWADREAWEPTDPPAGDGWQLWQTVSEGGPISPAFATPEELARWMASPEYTWGASKHSAISYESALAFVNAGWAPSFVSTPQTGLVSGVEYVGMQD
ncbi:hypothetical protein [Streptantibioticus silvisoli]|uniref:Uncharacterized protein n=1 Tax=Streptantibioticus silvisoli TaxID=2705255 RepID=A0ABT6W4L1_9ACTN|nr:hypothetical protein [Streptantibioticus silvisoli]MDI5965697.1 hypothetical protein [Streptantibioticus silvisoli]